MRIGRGVGGHGADRARGRVRADPVRLVPFPPRRPLRRGREHHRHPADHLRDHAARGGALLLDAVGLGQPLWALTELAIGALLRLAHVVASAPGAVAMMPSMPQWAFGLIVAGLLWLCLWTTRDANARAGAGCASGAVRGMAGGDAGPADHRRRAASGGRRRQWHAAPAARAGRRLCAPAVRRGVGVRRRSRGSRDDDLQRLLARCLRARHPARAARVAAAGDAVGDADRLGGR